jgi:hypothetical protein
VIGGSLILGDQDGLGDTFWRSLDAMAISGAIAEGGKLVFQRERPSQTSDPNRFFKGTRYQSFPSGEVAAIAGAVTPFMVKYGRDDPAVYALELLPLYDAIARVKTHGQGRIHAPVLAVGPNPLSSRQFLRSLCQLLVGHWEGRSGQLVPEITDAYSCFRKGFNSSWLAFQNNGLPFGRSSVVNVPEKNGVPEMEPGAAAISIRSK